MESFGTALRRLRGDRKAIGIARVALGRDATPTQVKSFANYIGRLERDDASVQNPSLELVTRLAKGLDVKLAEFFAAIEGVPTLNDPHPQKRQPRQEMTAVESDIESKGSESHGAALPLDVDAAAAIISGSILEAAERLASACDRLSTTIATTLTAAGAANQDAARAEQAPTRSTRAPKSRAHGTGRARKSA